MLFWIKVIIGGVVFIFPAAVLRKLGKDDAADRMHRRFDRWMGA